MSDLRKAAEMALEALDCLPWQASPIAREATQALRQALAQPEQECVYPECETNVGCDGPCGSAVEQEPVAWVIEDGEVDYYEDVVARIKPGTLLYAAPVDTVNTSQECVDETAKRGHEPYDQTALELCDKCGWKAIIPDEGCLVCARKNHEPVAWMEVWEDGYINLLLHKPTKYYESELHPLYIAPPKSEWVGLTDEEINEGTKQSRLYKDQFEPAVRWAESKLKEKNT